MNEVITPALGLALLACVGTAVWLLRSNRSQAVLIGALKRELDQAREEVSRKAVELEEAREHANLLRQVIDAMPQRVFVKDLEGRLLLVNEARAAWSGLKPSQMEGKSERELNPNVNEVENFQAADRLVIETGQVLHVPEERMCNSRGHFMWLETVKTPLRSSQGVIRGIIGVSTDISERKRSENSFNSILESLPVAVFMKTADELRFCLWNKSNEDICGLKRQAVLGKTDYDFFPKEQADFFTAKDKETLRSGKMVESEEEISTPHHGTRTFRTRKIPVPDENGAPWRLLGISEDITERRRAEAQLAQERAMLCSLLDGSADCIYFKDQQSRFVRTSRAFQKFGLNPEEILGKTDFDLFQESHARPAYNDEQQIMRTGKPIIGKIEREVLMSGEERWALTSKMPWVDANGRVVGTFGISKDITEMKRAEAKLEAVHQQLIHASRQAGMAEVATSVLHNVGNVLNSVNVSVAVLTRSVQSLGIANLSKAASMIREHMTDLGTYLSQDPKGKLLPDYLAQSAARLAEKQTSLLEEIRELSRHLDHVNDVVQVQQSYAKVAGMVEMVDPISIMQDALRMNATVVARGDIAVVEDYLSPAPMIETDRHKVLQVLVNLIRNATFACNESLKPERSIRLKLGMEGDARLFFEVTDNGVGIPPENLLRIFNHGFTTRKNGHGFGLHSSSLAAKEIGGELTVQSPGPGQGATFTLTLPTKRETSPYGEQEQDDAFTTAAV